MVELRTLTCVARWNGLLSAHGCRAIPVVKRVGMLDLVTLARCCGRWRTDNVQDQLPAILPTILMYIRGTTEL